MSIQASTSCQSVRYSGYGETSAFRLKDKCYSPSAPFGGGRHSPESACNNLLAASFCHVADIHDASGAPVCFAGARILDTYMAIAPGTYRLSAQGGTVVEQKALEGQVSDWRFELPVIGTVPGVFTTNITFADARELPDAMPTRITSSCGRDYTLPPGQSALALKAFRYSDCQYAVSVPGRTLPLTQTAVNDVVLHRIDVDDVDVTSETGASAVRGTYEIYYGGARIAGPFPTNTGVDALAGDYEVVVSYTTGIGPRTQRFTVRL